MRNEYVSPSSVAVVLTRLCSLQSFDLLTLGGLHLIHNALLQYQAYQQNPDRSFLVVPLDLLSGLTQGLGTALEPLINHNQPNLLFSGGAIGQM